jgi:hypothetical protein
MLANGSLVGVSNAGCFKVHTLDSLGHDPRLRSRYGPKFRWSKRACQSGAAAA